MGGGFPGSSEDRPRRLSRLRRSAELTLVERPSAFNFLAAVLPVPGGESSSGWLLALEGRCDAYPPSRSRGRRILKLFLGTVAGGVGVGSGGLEIATAGVGGGIGSTFSLS